MFEVLQGDVLARLSTIGESSFDAVITSPPYNLRASSGGFWNNPDYKGRWKASSLQGGYADHADNMPASAYIEWQRTVLDELMRVTADDGVIFYNHKWRVQNGLLDNRSEIVSGFPVRQVIIWQRNGGINFNDQYFLPTFEVIYMIAKPGFKLLPGANGLGDVWKVPYQRGNPHPAPMPLRIAENLVQSIAAPRILDPFMGSGTTGVAAIRSGRDFTGIELSAEYVELALDRLRGEEAAPQLEFATRASNHSSNGDIA